MIVDHCTQVGRGTSCGGRGGWVWMGVWMGSMDEWVDGWVDGWVGVLHVSVCVYVWG